MTFGFYEGPQLLLYGAYTGEESSSPMEKVTRQPVGDEMAMHTVLYGNGYSKPWSHKHWRKQAYWMD
jgi:hypothetical protein